MELRSAKTRAWPRAGMLVFMALAVLPVLAGSSYSWTRQGQPAGGIVSRLAINPSNPAILYALGANGVYESTDSGAAWTNVLAAPPGEPLDLAVDPLTPTTVYACGQQGMGLQKSTDGGKTWKHADSGFTLPSGNADTPASITVDPVDEGVLYAGSYNTGVYKSIDGGNTWTTIDTGLSGILSASLGLSGPITTEKVTVDPQNTQNLFLAMAVGGGSLAPAGVYTSTDGGTSWSQPLSGIEVDSVTVDPNHDQTVYAATGSTIEISTNGGANWSFWAHSVSGAQKLVIDAADSNHMFALTSGGMSETSDGGVTWNPVATGLPATIVGTVAVMDLAIDPTTPANVYLGSNGFGTYKSTDSGATWNASDTGLTALQFTAMTHDGQGNLYLGTAASGVLKSGDMGANWSFVNSGLSTQGGLFIGSLVPDAGAATTLYAVSTGAIFKTTDAGTSWTRLELGGIAAAVDPENGQTVYYGNGGNTPSGGGMSKSIDGGSTWSLVSTGLSGHEVTAVAVDPTNSNIVFAGTESTGLFVTTNGGGSWQPASTGLPTSSPQRVTALAIDPANPAIVYVSFVNNDIYKSVDGGSTWSSSSKGMAAEGVISSIQISDSPAVMYAMGNTGDVYQSTDAGADWSALSTTGNSAAFTPAAMMFVPGTPTNLYAAGTDGKVYLYSPVTTPPSGGSGSGSSGGGGGGFPLLGGVLFLGFTALRRKHVSVSLRGFAAIAAVFALCACAQLPASKAVDQAAQAKVTATQVVLLIPQSELYADNGGPTLLSGLVGAGIDAIKAHYRAQLDDKVLVPIRQELQGVDFNSAFSSGLQAGLAQVDWLHAGAPKLDTDTSYSHTRQIVSGAEQPYTLLLTADYHLSYDFRTLLVQVTASLLPRHSTAKGPNDEPLSGSDPRNAVFSQTVVYRANISDDTLDAIPVPPKPPVVRGPDGWPVHSDKPDLRDDEQRAVTFWTQDGGTRLRAALADAAAVTSRVISQALAKPLAAPAGAQTAKVDSYGKGLVLEQSPDRVLVLLKDDHGVVSSDAFDVDLGPSQPAAPARPN